MLGLYLGSIAIASITTGVYAIKVKKELKEEDYKVNKSKLNKKEVTKEVLGTLCEIVMPGINLIYTAIMLVLGNDICEGMKKTYLEKGYIYKNEIETNKNITNSNKYPTRRATTKKKYEDLTREEKRKLLQREIRDLIEERTNTNREIEGPKLQLKKTYNRNRYK